LNPFFHPACKQEKHPSQNAFSFNTG